MKDYCISNVGVDAGLIMVCDQNYYSKWGSKLKYGKNKYGMVCSQKIVVEPGVYKVKWHIPDTYNGPISGEGIIKTDSGIIAISDPCYCIKDWDRWLKDTNMGDDVEDAVILIDEMGGDDADLYELCTSNFDPNWLTELPHHSWIFYNDRHYDAENPEGVDHWRKLLIFTKFDGAVIAAYVASKGTRNQRIGD